LAGGGINPDPTIFCRGVHPGPDVESKPGTRTTAGYDEKKRAPRKPKAITAYLVPSEDNDRHITVCFSPSNGKKSALLPEKYRRIRVNLLPTAYVTATAARA
jgi:hypothetical protein